MHWPFSPSLVTCTPLCTRCSHTLFVHTLCSHRRLSHAGASSSTRWVTRARCTAAEPRCPPAPRPAPPFCSRLMHFPCVAPGPRATARPAEIMCTRRPATCHHLLSPQRVFTPLVHTAGSHRLFTGHGGGQDDRGGRQHRRHDVRRPRALRCSLLACSSSLLSARLRISLHAR